MHCSKSILCIPLLLTGCFRGLFSEAPKYLATEYVVDKPRIVAIRGAPVEMVSGAPAKLDALLIAPPEATIDGWTVSVCGLDPDSTTQTRIWDLLCFEKDEAVTQLIQSNTLPHSISTPTFPEIDTCRQWNDNFDTGIEDTGWIEEGLYNDNCAHQLPLMFEAVVDGQPVYAAGFTNWYATFPQHLRRDSTYSDAGVNLEMPTQAQSGEEILLQVDIAARATGATFQWYIDAGTLKDTGITAAHSYQAPSDTLPQPLTTSRNRLVVPDDFVGTLRVWVVIHEPWYHDLDMTWIEGSIEVSQ